MHATDASRALLASVLVVNRYYAAVHVVGVRRAFCLLYRQLAEVIDIEDGQYTNYDFDTWSLISEMSSTEKDDEEDWIQAVRCEILVPRVIRLLRYDRVPCPKLRFSRRNLFARDGHRCQYCGTSLPPSKLSLDHVVPRSRGGKTTWENIVCSCLDCNTRKGGRTPKEARMRLLRQPTKPRANPLLAQKLHNPKYEIWKDFLPNVSSLEIP